ncbi:MAG: 2-oxoacid:acceptor oxidoreductase family protein, partial [Verrucomicrobiae bacterium]|nr:2-oxoacid:acceptor oxidoreductase family protein [Verrucomicrobiae bacterium]
GQGVLKATDVVASVALRAGYDVKKSEIKGMSQRGGSVISDVRFGTAVLSPMVPEGEADFLVVLEPTQVEPHKHLLRPGGLLLGPEIIDGEQLANKRSFNVAMLGALSVHLPMPESDWLAVLAEQFPEKFHESNKQAFLVGRQSQQTR